MSISCLKKRRLFLGWGFFGPQSISAGEWDEKKKKIGMFKNEHILEECSQST